MIEDLRNSIPYFGASLIDNLLKDQVLLGRPLKLISTQTLDEEPSLQTFIVILGRYKLSYVFPVFLFEVFNVLLLLHSIRENTPL